jgi:pyruvate/2-oxoglutarate dehydrogenase complex dihydrolipoamide dehydrogenase (E3) component
LKTYDLIVLGGGAGGLVVAAGGAGLGAKVALIDKSAFGGDCLWTGCVPTKSLVHSASIIHQAKQAEQFGLKLTGKAEFSHAVSRLQEAISTIAHHDAEDRFEKLGIDVYKGYAAFHGKHEIIIDDKTIIQGKRIVIATGSRPFVPPIKGLQEAGFWTNEQALQATHAPDSLLVVGGGPIGLEFAQVFARFGTKVTVVEAASDILIREDQEMVPYVRRALEQDGVTFMTNTKMVQVDREQASKKVTFLQGATQVEQSFEQILVATGRLANTDRLHLERVGIELKANTSYIAVNNYLQTNLKHVFAIGDVNGYFPFTHKALYEGKAVVSSAVLGFKRKVNYRKMPWVTFTDPELYHLGLTEEEARSQFSKIDVYRTSLADVDRFIADGDVDGMVKIITRSNGQIVGAHAVGKGAGDFMQEVAYAMHYKQMIGSISHVIHPYPTHVGAVQRTADQYWRVKLFKGIIPKLISTYIRWFR